MIIQIEVENIDIYIKSELEHIYNMYMHYVAKYLTSVTLHEKEKYKRWAKEEFNKIIFIESAYKIKLQEVLKNEKQL